MTRAEVLASAHVRATVPLAAMGTINGRGDCVRVAGSTHREDPVRQSLRMFAAMILMASGFAAHAGQTEYDPAKVSDSLKAVFKFGSVSTKKALNANTVTLLTGTIGGTYVQFGAERRRHPFPERRRSRHRARRHARLSREEGLRQRHQEAVHLCDQALQ